LIDVTGTLIKPVLQLPLASRTNDKLAPSDLFLFRHQADVAAACTSYGATL